MRKVVFWIIKNFWFPILVAILGSLAKKHTWAAKAHGALKKVS
jgi:hypothetical protein